MTRPSKIDSSELSDLSRVIEWYIGLRWIACALVFAALATARWLLLYELPYPVLFTLAATLALVNLAFGATRRLAGRARLSRRGIGALFHLQVCCDYLLLLLLVYFAGTLENPFAYFFVFHIMLTAFIFPERVVYTYALSLAALLAALVASESAGLLPHFPLDPARFDAAAYRASTLARTVGLLATLLASAYMMASIKSRIEERGRRVEVELDRYRDLDRAKSDFILQVTHELRGPLAALTGYHEMILKGITGEIAAATRETLGRAERRTGNLLAMIDEMIDFAYMKAQEDLRPELRAVSVRDAIYANLDSVAPQATERRVTLAADCPRETTVWASRDLLNIILGNLIGNAVKYARPGTSVLVSAEVEGTEVHLRVADEGIGIEEQDLERIFEEFYRTRRARVVERDGTGLGLAIVQRAVRALGGRITVYSEVDRGSTFHVYLSREGGRHEPDTDHR